MGYQVKDLFHSVSVGVFSTPRDACRTDCLPFLRIFQVVIYQSLKFVNSGKKDDLLAWYKVILDL
jgi:hypothetical protein